MKKESERYYSRDNESDKKKEKEEAEIRKIRWKWTRRDENRIVKYEDIWSETYYVS